MTAQDLMQRARAKRAERDQQNAAAAARAAAQHTETLQRRGVEESNRILGIKTEPGQWTPIPAADGFGGWDPRKNATAELAGETFIIDIGREEPLQLGGKCDRHGNLARVGWPLKTIADLADVVDHRDAGDLEIRCWDCIDEDETAKEAEREAARAAAGIDESAATEAAAAQLDDDETIANAILLGIRAMIQQELHTAMLETNRAALEAEAAGS
jgi:hypothetical protein